ncbi:MAG: VTT domain-containing protein [Candidatus Kariarchaeaceae archaeon]|jgi:uncharacterized membrane protein YdjX (TVP38/TMEM64 family)
MLEFLLDPSLNPMVLAIVFLVLLIGQAIVVFFPKDATMILVGFFFGSVFGGVINVIGLFGASWLGYELGSTRIFKRKRIISNKYYVLAQDWLQRHGMKALIFGRILPIMPYNIISLTSGMTKLKRIQCLTINLLAAIPYAFFFAYIGSTSVDFVMGLIN